MIKALRNRIATRPSDQLTAQGLRRLIWGLVCGMWAPMPALAAVVAATGDTLEVPLLLLVLALVVSTLSGATALLMRIDRELSAAPDKPLPRPWLMSTAHMLSAWLAGVAAFLISRANGWDAWTTLGFVLGASFAGAKFLEAMLERFPGGRINPGAQP